MRSPSDADAFPPAAVTSICVSSSSAIWRIARSTYRRPLLRTRISSGSALRIAAVVTAVP